MERLTIIISKREGETPEDEWFRAGRELVSSMGAPKPGETYRVERLDNEMDPKSVKYTALVTRK